ncbi:patatin-like phospholipase family protein [Nitratireductor basaltis]|uniref:Patatin n=1 Tax=Nitratireductor basaltis TaxID=472175 RepID=A0A084UD91_9HYPH|nr:patatin-like phospholipase family protein [Nitratireductor basaltis]KFB10927.1 Patatin [Nitratireductor basaltis]
MHTKVFCVFEGGGAKGVAHVGALRAIENVDDYEVKGFAGTSAGAIVAALAAVGWSSYELVKQHDDGRVESQALQAIGNAGATSLAQLFGDEWKKLERLGGTDSSEGLGTGWLRKTRAKWLSILIFLAMWPMLYHVGRWLAGDWSGWAKVLVELVASGAWISYLIVWVWVLRTLYKTWFHFRGVANIAPVIQVLDKLFEAKINPRGDRVTFRDVREQSGSDLKIVAANIHSGAMKLFDAAGTPDIAVADAVAASACIPVAFSPVEIEGQQFCDGGIVSNLPAWTFDDERLLDNESLIVTCELLDGNTRNMEGNEVGALEGTQLLLRMARTAVFGGAALNTRGLQHHIRIPLEPDVGILEFDKTEKHLKAVDDAEKVAELRIDSYRFEQESLTEIHDGVVVYLHSLGITCCRLRAALVREVKLVDSPPAAYTLWCNKGFEGYRDTRLLLPLGESLVGRSVKECRPCSLDLTVPHERSIYHRLDQRPLGAQMLPNDRKWVVVVPFNRWPEGQNDVPPEHISVAVTLDGDVSLPGDMSDHRTKLRNIVDKHGVFTPY